MAIKTFTAGSVLTASDTNTYLANAGLVYITSTTFTSSSSISVDNCFSSTYDAYRLVLSCYNTGAALKSVQLRLRVGGTTTTGADYFTKGWYNFGTLTGYNAPTQTHFYMGDCSQDANQRGHFIVDLWNVNKAQRTAMWCNCVETYNAYAYNFTSTHVLNTAYTGFNLAPDSNSLTGLVTVYGYRIA